MPQTAAAQTKGAVKAPLWIAQSGDVAQSVPGKQFSGALVVTHVDEHNNGAGALDLLALPGHVRQSLATKGASKVTQKDEQNRRSVRQRREGLTIGHIGIAND